MTESRLDQIGLRYNTDKSSAVHNYLPAYERYIATLPHKVTDILEIGVYDGGSVRTWAEFFPDARITGVDIDPRCLAYAGGRIAVELCDQGDALALQRLQHGLRSRHDAFDIILDDGSHVWAHQILTFETLFSSLRPGGLFIIEDIDTSYGDHVQHYGRDSTVTAADYVLLLASYLLGGGQKRLDEEPNLRLRAIAREVDSVVMIRRSALIFRK